MSPEYVRWNIRPGQKEIGVNEASKYWAVLAEASAYYKESGLRRSPRHLKKYLESALRVSEMVRGFPSPNSYDNALRFFCWGAIEGQFVKDYVATNIPGMKINPRLGSVSWFSVDYGWAGVNEINVVWTYRYAVALQRGVKPNKVLRDQLHNSAEAFVAANIRIPAKLALKRVSVVGAKQAKAYWLRTGDRRHKSYYQLVSGFHENSADDLDSMLLYRVLVEVDRRHRGWTYRTWEKPLYRRLAKARPA